MGCICSKCCPTSGEENGADNARVSEQKPSSRRNKQNTVVSTGYPLDVNPGQPSKNQSTHTEDSITSSDTSIPPVADYAGTAPYPANSVAGHTVFEARPLDTQRSENLTPPSDVTPDQPEKNLFTLTESSMTASDTSTSPPTNQVAILTTYIPDIMTGPTVAESQPPEAETEKRPSVLWEKAFTKIREPNNGHSGDETFPKGSLVENIINDLKERKEQCDDKRWFIIKDDRKVFIVDNLLVQLNKYAAIGDIALQHNPEVVALVWAGFRGLLQAGIAYVNLMRSVSESLDYLVELLCCCDIYEKLYCNTKFGISEDLNKCFVNLYASILKYLRKMSIYLNHNTGGRIIRSFSQEIQDLLNDIKSKQQELKEKIDVAEKEASASNRFDQDKNIKKLRGLLIEIQEPIAGTLHVVEIIYNEVRNDRRLKILTWLSEVEYESHHLLSVQRRLHGTGSWLQESGHFIRWRESETNPILWLRADAGFGKTILASSVVDSFEHLSTSDDHVVAYFYCNYKEPTRRSTESILRTLVKQFCVKGRGENKIPTLVDRIYKEREAKGGARGQLSTEESTELIIGLSEGYQSTTILVDALDECDIQTRRALFSALHRIAETATRVKIVVTSRYDADIHQFFSGIPNYYIEAKDNSADINLYIEAELKRRCDGSNVHCEDALLLGGEVDQDLRDLITETLRSKANGMFMWVNLQIDALCAAQTAEDVRSALSTMPETLNETYLQVMERIKAQDRNAHRVAKEILKWLLYAQEACTTGSVIQALAVEPEKKSLNKSGLSWTVLKIMGICKNLVIHDKTLNIFRFAHFSVQEFLLSQAEYEKKTCNSYIAKVCLTTLLYHHASDPVQDLYTYAARNWAAHVRLSEATSGKVEDLSNRFWKSTASYKAWGSTITKVDGDLALSEGGEAAASPFWVACHYELQYLDTLLLRVSNQELNSRNRDGRTSLSWAAGNGREKVVQLLLEKEGVDVDSKSNGEQTPLSYAAQRGHEKVVQLLLEKEGVDVDSKDAGSRAPLSYAAQNGYEKVVQLLLEKEGVDVDSKSNGEQTPLSYAAQRGHVKVVQLLLEKEGVDVDSKDAGSRTPLSYAAQNGYENVVQLLLEKERVDVNSGDNTNWTPLHYAARNGHVEVVQLLLEKEGADVELKDSGGQTPLSYAAERGRGRVVQLLLEKEGLQADSKDNYGETPLFWAAKNGYARVVQLLLEKGGVDANPKNSDGETPLDKARVKGHSEVVRVLETRLAELANVSDPVHQLPVERIAADE